VYQQKCYLSIGHEDDKETVLWIYLDGRIKTRRVIHQYPTDHPEIFGADHDRCEVSGRYDLEKKIISLGGGKDWPERKMDYVKKKLWKAFPKAIEIMEFNY